MVLKFCLKSRKQYFFHWSHVNLVLTQECPSDDSRSNTWLSIVRSTFKRQTLDSKSCLNLHYYVWKSTYAIWVHLIDWQNRFYCQFIGAYNLNILTMRNNFDWKDWNLRLNKIDFQSLTNQSYQSLLSHSIFFVKINLLKWSYPLKLQ